MIPAIGRIVHYKLTNTDVQTICDKRSSRLQRNPLFGANNVSAGDVFPAMIVKVWSPGSIHSAAQLKVFLDGDDCYWATSRTVNTAEDHAQGTYEWPSHS